MKKLCGRLMFASPSVSADILYAGGFHAPDDVIYFEIPGRKALILSHLEFARGRREAKRGVEVLNRESFFRENDLRTDLNVMRNLSSELGVKRWDVPSDFPLETADLLRAAGIEIVPVHGAYFPKRQIKTAAELKKIADAESVTEESMRYARDLIRESHVNSKGYLILSGKLLTSERLRSEIEGFLKARGYTASQTITACGPASSRPHELGSGPLSAGEPIVCDIFPRSDLTGYWGDMTRTFCKGKASPIVRKAYAAVLKASELALKLIRNGALPQEVHNAAKESMTADGFPTGRNKNGNPVGFIHGLGHGLGLDIHEAPRVSPLNQNPLKTGNVVSVEPGLYDEQWGGIRLEDIVAVEQKGCRNFNTMEKELEIG